MKTRRARLDMLKRLTLSGSSVLLALSLLGGSAFAQAERISAAEFWPMMAKANRLTDENPFRAKRTVEMSESMDGPWEFYSSGIHEFVSRDRERIVQLTGYRYENIIIGDTVYFRKNGGEWTVRISTSAKSRSGGSVEHVDPPNLAYRKTKSEKGVVMVEVVSTVAPLDSKPNGRMRYWFDTDGHIVKTEEIDYIGTRKGFARVTETYEYDPAITINSPIQR